MNMASFLPLRWRSSKQATRHNEAIAGILRTAPIIPDRDGLVIFSKIGSADVPPFLVAVKSLWHHIQRGRIVIMDDGTLTAPDRTILAQHCGDPQFLRAEDTGCAPFPAKAGWEPLLAILDNRLGEYWLHLHPDTVTIGPVPELSQAISSNRSFALLAGADAPSRPLPLGPFVERCFPEGPRGGSLRDQVESRLTGFAPQQSWQYLRANPALCGFAAGNAGRELALAYWQRWQARFALGEEATTASAELASGFLIANEGAPICLPYSRYRSYCGGEIAGAGAVLQFAKDANGVEKPYIHASQLAIAQLSTSI